MSEDFNPQTPNPPRGAYVYNRAPRSPPQWYAIRHSQRIVEAEEGPNDGLVSVASSRWGDGNGYKGTLVNVSHLDLINWTNRLRWLVWELTGHERKLVLYPKFVVLSGWLKRLGRFNAIAFYLDIGGEFERRFTTLRRLKTLINSIDMLAKEGY